MQNSSAWPAQRRSVPAFKTVRAKEAHLLNLTSVGPWSRNHTEWDNDYLSSTQCGLIARVRGVPNAWMPHEPQTLLVTLSGMGVVKP